MYERHDMNVETRATLLDEVSVYIVTITPYTQHRLLTSGEGECAEVRKEVAWPLSFVLSEALTSLLTDTGGQVWVGLRGKALACFRRCWSE